MRLQPPFSLSTSTSLPTGTRNRTRPAGVCLALTVEPEAAVTVAVYSASSPAPKGVAQCVQRQVSRRSRTTPQAVPRVLPKHRYMFAGQLERFGGVFRRWRDDYTRRNETFDGPTDIESCTGCFMTVRTAVLKAVGGFDERFFMYMEDADLSRRLARHGRLVLLPQVSVVHRWEKASGKSLTFLKIHLRSMRLYFSKWRREA